MQRDISGPWGDLTATRGRGRRAEQGTITEPRSTHSGAKGTTGLGGHTAIAEWVAPEKVGLGQQEAGQTRMERLLCSAGEEAPEPHLLVSPSLFRAALCAR